MDNGIPINFTLINLGEKGKELLGLTFLNFNGPSPKHHQLLRCRTIIFSISFFKCTDDQNPLGKCFMIRFESHATMATKPIKQRLRKTENRREKILGTARRKRRWF